MNERSMTHKANTNYDYFYEKIVNFLAKHIMLGTHR